MTLLQVFFILSGIVISMIALRIARRERFNALHFAVFVSVGVGLFVLGFFPSLVDDLGRIFGAEGADVLVYLSITFLFYFVLLLLQKVETNRQEITKLIREMALEKHHHGKK